MKSSKLFNQYNTMQKGTVFPPNHSIPYLSTGIYMITENRKHRGQRESEKGDLQLFFFLCGLGGK